MALLHELIIKKFLHYYDIFYQRKHLALLYNFSKTLGRNNN